MDTLAHLRWSVYKAIDKIKEARKEGVETSRYIREFHNIYRLYKACNQSKCHYD